MLKFKEVHYNATIACRLRVFAGLTPTCQGADVFAGVVFAESLLFCNVAHRHVETQTVFI